ncbi:head decoration protein [Ancylobacter amanitiformis]|uniref:Head decoration protein n=1 Tax=Ancylobacter amanitiformis TaxID=217069 RepID=A0ABU0LQD0_9HYPH|nr:head decoration protein [Ancylobacter amanitiformis]MDQ0510886.1 hypothetical protein [Ancylobacter amanitiformis]
MPTLTEGPRPGEFIMSEANWHRSRDVITIAAGAGKVPPNTVLGKVTASSKYVPSPATGSDGSQVGTVVSIYGVDATSVDVKVTVIARDAEINGKCLNYEATVNDDTKKAAKATQLAAAGIIVRN